MSAVAAEPRVLSAVSGRLRVHLPAWSGDERRGFEGRLRRLPGVGRVEANSHTRNILLTYDPQATRQQKLLDEIRQIEPPSTPPPTSEPKAPLAWREGHGRHSRARIAVRGLDRDPNLSARVVKRLQSHPGVRARANPLTGRVLVDFDEKLVSLKDLLETVSDVELPELPGEDCPSHPMDPAPLIQSAARTATAAIGLSFQMLRRLTGYQVPPPVARKLSIVSGGIGLLQGFPFFRNGLREILGRDAADLSLNVINIATQAFTSSPLGLLVMGAESLVLLNEVVSRRAAWRAYVDRLSNAAPPMPGATVRLEVGERIPLDGKVMEGAGTAIGRDGLPVALCPNAEVPAGSRIIAGSAVVELEGGEAFIPQPRPAPPRPDLYRYYTLALGPASLAYALLTAVVTRSLDRTFQALLLVNPRTAVIGMEAATLDAATRATRGGAVIVATRRHRPIRLPDFLLLDGSRLLTRGMEVSEVVPLVEGEEPAALVALAGAVAAAAGSPWGGSLVHRNHLRAADGDFDGATASATVEGQRYVMGPHRAHHMLPAADRLKYHGQHLLLLRREGEEHPLAMLALRPALAAGVDKLCGCCRRNGAQILILPHGNRAAAHAVARRTGATLLDSADAVEQIRQRQARGAIVAFVSDSATAGAGYAAADLGIGMRRPVGRCRTRGVARPRPELRGPRLAGADGCRGQRRGGRAEPARFAGARISGLQRPASAGRFRRRAPLPGGGHPGGHAHR